MINRQLSGSLLQTEGILMVRKTALKLNIIVLLVLLSPLVIWAKSCLTQQIMEQSEKTSLLQHSITDLASRKLWPGKNDTQIYTITQLPGFIRVSDYLAVLENIDQELFKLESLEVDDKEIILSIVTSDTKLEKTISELSNVEIFKNIKLLEVSQQQLHQVKATLIVAYKGSV